MEVNTIAIGHRWDFTKEDRMVFVQEGGVAKKYRITQVHSESTFSFEFPLCPGFGEGTYGEA